MQKEKRRVIRKRDWLTKGPRLMSNILKKSWIACAKIFYDAKKWDKGAFLGGSGGFK